MRLPFLAFLCSTVLALEYPRKPADPQPSGWPLTDEERAEVTAAMNRLKVVYCINDHHLIHAQVDILNQATHKLAENMMNTAVQGALQGTKVE